MAFNMIKKEELNISSDTGLLLNKYSILENNNQYFLQLKIINNSSSWLTGFVLTFNIDSVPYSYQVNCSISPNEAFFQKNLIKIKGINFEFIKFSNITYADSYNEDNSDIVVKEYDNISINDNTVVKDDDQNQTVIKHKKELVDEFNSLKNEYYQLDAKINDIREEQKQCVNHSNFNEKINNLNIFLQKVEAERVNKENDIKNIQQEIDEIDKTEYIYQDNIITKQKVVDNPKNKKNILLIVSIIIVSIITTLLCFIPRSINNIVSSASSESSETSESTSVNNLRDQLIDYMENNNDFYFVNSTKMETILPNGVYFGYNLSTNLFYMTDEDQFHITFDYKDAAHPTNVGNFYKITQIDFNEDEIVVYCYDELANDYFNSLVSKSLKYADSIFVDRFGNITH